MDFEIASGDFTQAELKAAKEHNIEPAWLRRILNSYATELAKIQPVNIIFKEHNESRHGYCPNSMARKR